MKKLIVILVLLILVIISGCATCKEKDGCCCKGGECSCTEIKCAQGTNPEFQGCNNKCIAQWSCIPNSNS